MTNLDELKSKVAWDDLDRGLLPAVIQDSRDQTVLMVAWMNQEAVDKTFETGRVTFFSRSRQALWTKGETSGNYLDFHSCHLDCDGDTLLVQATPLGPTCHTGQRTCFGEAAEDSIGFLRKLQAVIDSRCDSDPESSYTAQLLHGDFHRVAQKVGEEAVEAILAATSRSKDDLIDESADLVYHLMVMLRAKGVDFSEVTDRLQSRHS